MRPNDDAYRMLMFFLVFGIAISICLSCYMSMTFGLSVA